MKFTSIKIVERIDDQYNFTFTIGFVPSLLILAKLIVVFAIWGMSIGLIVLAVDLVITAGLFLVLKHLVTKEMKG